MYPSDVATGEPPQPEALLAAARALAGVEVGELSDDEVRTSLVTLSKVRAVIDAALVDRAGVVDARALQVRDGALTPGGVDRGHHPLLAHRGVDAGAGGPPGPPHARHDGRGEGR